jgi:hypothetical protein
VKSFVLLIAAAACVLGLALLASVLPREDANRRRPDSRGDSSVSRARDPLPHPGEGGSLRAGARSARNGALGAPGYESASDTEGTGTQREEDRIRSTANERYVAGGSRLGADRAATSSIGDEASRTTDHDGGASDASREDTRLSSTTIHALAADLANQLELIEPEQLEQLVERAVPDGSLPPEDLEEARNQVRDQLLGEELLLEYLVEQALPDDATMRERQVRRQMGSTLLSWEGQEFIDSKLAEVLSEYGSQP